MRDSSRMKADTYLDMISPTPLDDCLPPASSRLAVRILVCTRRDASCGPVRERPMDLGLHVASDMAVKHSGSGFVSIT